MLIVLSKQQIALTFHVPEFVAASLYALFFLVIGLGGKSISSASERFGFRGICIAAGLSTILGSVVCWYTDSFILFVFSYGILICFFGSAPFLAPLIALTINFFPDRPALTVAVPTMGQLVAFGPWRQVFNLVDTSTNWRSGFLVLACGGLFQIILGMKFNSKTSQPPAVVDWQWRGLPVRIFAANLFLLTFSATVFVASLKEIEGNLKFHLFGLFEVFSLFALLGRLCLAAFFDKGHHSTSLLVSSLCTLVACGLFSFDPNNSAIALFAAASLGFGYSGYLPVMVAFTKIHCLGSRQRNARQMLMFGCLGVAVGSIASGYSTIVGGFQVKFLFSFISCLLSVGIGVFGIFQLSRELVRRP